MTLGGAVAVDGDTIGIGATQGSGAEAVGQVFVYVRSGSGWVEAQRLVATGGHPGDGFGYALALQQFSVRWITKGRIRNGETNRRSLPA